MRIAIFDQFGQRSMIHEDGQRIYDSILGPLLAGQTVTLDFTGVTQCAAPFFNSAIGQLFKDVAEQIVREKLVIENLNATGNMIVKRVMENAFRYHTDPVYRQIVDNILESQAKELF
jgi:hypothetical protein